jgi:hypothetical protein
MLYRILALAVAVTIAGALAAYAGSCHTTCYMIGDRQVCDTQCY